MNSEERAFTKKGATTRDRIVTAARDMLLERGYDGLVMRELADSLGIKLGNLQYYFTTREEVALHVLRLEGTRDAALVDDLLGSDDPLDAFRTVISDMVTRYRGDSGRLLSIITALAQHNRSFRQLYADSYSNFYPPFEALLTELNPDLPQAEIAIRPRLVNALVEGSSFQTHIADLEAYFGRLVAEAEAIALAS